LQAFEELASLSPARLLSINNSNVVFPSNVSGTFKGSWSLSQPNTSSYVMPVLNQGQGTVAFQLTAVSSGQDEVLDIQVGLDVQRKTAMQHCLASFVCPLLDFALGCMGVTDQVHLHAACPFKVDDCMSIVQFTDVFTFIHIGHLHVQGGLVLRKGAYRSEHDTFMEVDGVYVTATGQLQAVLKPVDRVKLNLEQQDFDLQTADYR